MDRRLTYAVLEIPDPFYFHYQRMAGGDVRAAAARDFESILRAVAGLPSGSASMSMRFVFDPNPRTGDMQSRLGVYLIICDRRESMDSGPRLLIERGPVTRFYQPRTCKGCELPWESFNAVCEIVRREDTIEPLHAPELNDRIPPCYYAISLFEANRENDYLALDRALSGVEERVVVDICVEPTDISKERWEHTRYLSRLQSINRPWDREDVRDAEVVDYVGDDTPWRVSAKRSPIVLRYRDPLADDVLRSQQQFHESLRQPHLLFQVRVLAESAGIAQLVSSVVAESSLENGGYRIVTWDEQKNMLKEIVTAVKETRNVATALHERLFKKKEMVLYTGLARLAHCATVNELVGIARLPVASSSSPHCIRKNTDPPPVDGREVFVVGFERTNHSPEQKNTPRLWPPELVPKHMFDSGGSGSGKTTSVMHLALQFHRANTPFLIVEPVKNEYRRLKTLRESSDRSARSLGRDLEIYTPGIETVSPFRLNPLSIRPGVCVDEHIDNTLMCFLAAMPVTGPLPALLGEGLERVYEECPNPDKPPILADLNAAVGRVLMEKGYSAETNSDIRAALEVRLGSLVRRSIGRVFQCRHSVPTIDHLMGVPAVIELDRLHQEQACLLTLFLLTSIREYLKTVPADGTGFRYAIIIEEAHNIVGRTGQAIPSPDIADPKPFAAEYVCRMLAELRAVGVGVIIVDQLPSAVAPEVIKNTGTKLCFRQVDKEDREVLGAAMLMTQAEMEDVARLKPGEAFLFTEGYHGPRRIQTVNLNERFDFGTSTMNEKILPFLSKDPWFREAAFRRNAQELGELHQHMDRFEQERARVTHELSVLVARYPQILVTSRRGDNEVRLTDLRNEAQALGRCLKTSFNSFVRNSYTRYLPLACVGSTGDPDVEELRERLVDRFESVIRRDVHRMLRMINALSRRCNSKGGQQNEEAGGRSDER